MSTKENKMQDDTSQLKSLGSGKTDYVYEVDPSKLEFFPNKAKGKCYRVVLFFPEFTSLCPKTKQPDFGTIEIRYVPDSLCIESKGLKLYLFSFRNSGMFMETIVNQIADDLFEGCKPKSLLVIGNFNPRGGIEITPTAFRGSEEFSHMLGLVKG